MLKTIGLTLAALVIALPAAAQTVCVTERGDVLKQLSSQFEENPKADLCFELSPCLTRI